MSGKRRLTKSIKGLDVTKLDKPRQVRGILGNTINGNQVVEVPTRPGYVWVRLRDQQSEIIQAFNDDVSPVYDLPVFVTRDSDDPTRYIIVGRDTAQYANWGAGAAYLPRHANQHSFSDDAGAAGDVVWVYGRQFMPMLAYPSGSAGAGNVIISPYTYFSQAQDWVYSGGTGTASIVAYKPTGSNARVVLVYMDTNGNPQLLPGDYFASTITGTSQVIQYLPDLPNNTKPIAAVRLVSGTSIINWSNIYDVRQFYNDSVIAPTASAPNPAIAIYDDHAFVVTGTVLDFISNISVAVTGSVAFISSTGGGGGGTGSSTVGARVYSTGTSVPSGLAFNTKISFNSEDYDTDNIHSGSSTQLFCNTAGYYLISAQAMWTADSSGEREVHIILNGNTANIIAANYTNNAGAAISLIQQVSTVYYLNIGDYVEVVVRHDSTTDPLTIHGTTPYQAKFMMQRFGDGGSTVISTGTVVINNYTNNVLPIFDGSVFKVTGTAVSFDDNLTVSVSGTVAFVSSSAAGGGGLSALPIQDDGSFVVSGTAISFDKDLIVTASGTVAHVEVPAGTFASGSHTHPAGATAIQIYDDSAYKATGTAISFERGLIVSATGTVAYIDNAFDWFNVEEYGAIGDGITDNTIAIDTAIAALDVNGGGVLYFPAGTYLTSGSHTLANPTIVLGDGSLNWNSDTVTASASMIECASTTATVFTITTPRGAFKDIAIVNTAGSPPSSGAGVEVSGAAVSQWINFHNVVIAKFYINVDVQTGSQWVMDSSLLIGAVQYNLKIDNTINPDAGDWNLSNSYFFGGSGNNTAACIRIEGSGGGKIVNCKINQAAGGGSPQYGIDLASNETTSILLVSNSSFENLGVTAIRITTTGGTWDYMTFIGNQFALYGGSGNAIDINCGALGQVEWVNIHDNIFKGAGTNAISLTNVNRVNIGGNHNVDFTNLLAQSGCTNIVYAVEGVVDTATLNLTATGSYVSGDVIPGGIKLDDLGTPDDNTDLNASTSRHGLLPKLDNNATHFLNGQGNWVLATSSPLLVYEKGTLVGTGTSITFDGNLEVSTSGSFISISAPTTTYFRVGQPSLVGGTIWQVPDRVYASGSLAVSIDGLMKVPGLDYEELLWVSGTYQYLSTPATGTVHLVMYGVPCTPQIQTSSGGVSAFALLDSNDVLLLDSNSVQILDSNG